MRKSFLLVLIVLSVALVSVGVLLLLQDAPPEMPMAVTTTLPGGEVTRIGVQELSEQLQGNAPPVVWEFVSGEQFASGHLPGAKLLTFDALPAEAEKLAKTQPIVTLCT